MVDVIAGRRGSRAVAAAALWAALALPPSALGQAPAPPDPTAAAKPAAAKPAEAARPADAVRQAEKALAAEEPKPPEAPPPPAATELPQMDLLELLLQGGPLMIPIGLFSVLVVALGFERFIALRRKNLLPRKLVQQLRGLVAQGQGLDPREAIRVCQRHPSAAASVLRAMLVRPDRSAAELETAAQEAVQREADRLNGNVRWLTLSAALAPMLGLLGTVQGMIQAFFITSHLPPGANRAVFLAESIYVALVTTFGGLTVAIPAALLAHVFGGKILRTLRELEDLVPVLVGQVERFQRRRGRDGVPTSAPAAPAAPNVARPPATAEPTPVPRGEEAKGRTNPRRT